MKSKIQENFKNKSLRRTRTKTNSLFQGFFKNHLQFNNNSRNTRNSRIAGRDVFPSFPRFWDSKGHIEVEKFMSWIGLLKLADLVLGITQKLCRITSSPANEWCAISPARAQTHTSIYLGVIPSNMQYFVWVVNRTTTLQQVCSVIFLKRYTSVVFTCFCLPSFGRTPRKSIMQRFLSY